MPKAKTKAIISAPAPHARKNTEHPDKVVLAVSAELCAILAGENPQQYEDRLDLLKESLLNLDVRTLEGCRARILAIEAAWPSVYDRLLGEPKAPHDDVFWDDWGRLPETERSTRHAARMRARFEDRPPQLTPAEVLERALNAAEHSACTLLDALGVFEAMSEREGNDIKIPSDTLDWLVEKLKADVSDLMEDIRNAEYARNGKTYDDVHKRYF